MSFKLSIICAGLLCLGTVASAKDTIYRDWALSCSSPGTCQLAQTLMSDERSWLATVQLARGAGPVLSVLVPQGAHFPSGIYAKLPGITPQRLTWQRCSEAACQATAKVAEPVLRAMRRHRQGWVLYRPSPSAPPVEVAFSLMGITAGLTALAQETETRP